MLVGPVGCFQKDVTLLVQFELAFQEIGIGRVADCQKYARRLEFLRLLVDGACQLDAGYSLLVIPQNLDHRAVPLDVHFGVGQGSLLHDLAGTQSIATMDQMNNAGELGEVGRFLNGGITPAHDHDGLLAKAGQCSIAYAKRRHCS